MRGTTNFPIVASKLFKQAMAHGWAGVLLFGISILSLSGCVAYDPYPPQPIYYQPAPYYVAPAPSYYYYQPCCVSYFDFGYSHGYGHRYYGHGHR